MRARGNCGTRRGVSKSNRERGGELWLWRIVQCALRQAYRTARGVSRSFVFSHSTVSAINCHQASRFIIYLSRENKRIVCCSSLYVFFLYFPERFVLTKCSNREFYLYLNLLYKEHCWKSSIDCCATRKKLFFCDFVWKIQWRIGTMCSNDESVWEDKENLGQLFQALKGALVGQWGTMKFCSYDS